MCHGADRLLHKALGKKGKKESSIVEIKMKRDVQLQAELFFLGRSIQSGYVSV